jgi:hypothetical protein
MLNDILLVCSALGLWFALGYPVARTLGPHVLSPALAAPPLGLAIHATLTTILYVSGPHLSTAYQLSAVLAIPGVVLAIRDRLFSGWGRSECAFLATLPFAMLLVLLPKWIGPPEFSVFQGNVGDQFSYLSTAFMASHYAYAMLQHTNDALLVPLPYPSLTTRPSVILVFGSFASILHGPVLVLSYAYLGALQICILFAATFVSRNLFRLSTAVALWVALGLTVGFFAQYTFDINAWSHLASVSLIVLYAGLFVLGLLTNRPTRPNDGVLSADGFFWSMLVCATGFLYIYPETLPIAVAISVPALICQFLDSSNRSYVFRRLMLLGLAAAFAIALCTFAWQLTIGTFLDQSRWLVDTASAGGPLGQTELWPYFQAYFFGYDNDPNTAFDFRAFLDHSLMRFLYRLLSIYTSFLAGAFGVYFLQPDTSISVFALLTVGMLAGLACIFAIGLRGLLRGKSERVDFNLLAGGLGGLLVVLAPLWFGLYVSTEKSAIPIIFPVRIMWKLALGASLTTIITFWIRSLLRRSRLEPRLDRILFVGVMGAFGLLGGLVLSGQYWAAGKGLIMLSPVLFLSVVGSVLGSEGKWKMIKIFVLIYVGTQIGFGAYRSYAAAQENFGVHYGAPYPVASYPKRLYRWDYGGLRKELTGCSRVDVALEGQHEIFVEMTLIDAGIHWSSQRLVPNDPAGTQKQIEKPDCIVTTEVRGIQPGYKIIWLRRDDRVWRFYRGDTNRLDLVPNVPLELETEGLAAEESRIVGLAWTNGHAVIHVPNNPRAPIRRLTLAVSPERLPPDIHVTVLINGRGILDEVVARGPIWTDWTRTVELPDFSKEAWLKLEVNSDTYVYPNDTRTLGARLHFLSLER